MEDMVVGALPMKRNPIRSHGSMKFRLVAHRLTIAKVAAAEAVALPRDPAAAAILADDVAQGDANRGRRGGKNRDGHDRAGGDAVGEADRGGDLIARA